MVVLNVPATDAGCISAGKDEHYHGPWPAVLAVAPGPQSTASLGKLFREWYVDLPTYVSRKCEESRRNGKSVPTGWEEFDDWRRAPASVRGRWPAEDLEDLRAYTRQALARWK